MTKESRFVQLYWDLYTFSNPTCSEDKAPDLCPAKSLQSWSLFCPCRSLGIAGAAQNWDCLFRHPLYMQIQGKVPHPALYRIELVCPFPSVRCPHYCYVCYKHDRGNSYYLLALKLQYVGRFLRNPEENKEKNLWVEMSM